MILSSKKNALVCRLADIVAKFTFTKVLCGEYTRDFTANICLLKFAEAHFRLASDTRRKAQLRYCLPR